MGYNRNLKNRRNPVIKYIKEKLIELDKENISDEEIFEICDTILKVVELHFKIQKYDPKMYNKYNKMILFEILPTKIFRLDYMKSKDYNTSINMVIKEKSKDLKFIYLYALKHYMNIATLYNDINQNVMDGWITEEDNKKVLFSDKNEYLNKAISNDPNIKLRLHEHILKVNEYLNNKNIKIQSKEFYNKLQKLVNDSIINIKSILNKDNQINFYGYHLSELSNNLKDTLYMRQYCQDITKCINDYLNKDN